MRPCAHRTIKTNLSYSATLQINPTHWFNEICFIAAWKRRFSLQKSRQNHTFHDFFYYTIMQMVFIKPNFNFWWLHPPHWSEVILESFRESLIRLVHAALAKCKTKPGSGHWTFSNFLPAILLWEYSTI